MPSRPEKAEINLNVDRNNLYRDTIATQDLGFSPDAMDEWMAFVAPFGNVRENIPWRDYTDIAGLHVAQEALGLPNNPSADLSSGQELTANF